MKPIEDLKAQHEGILLMLDVLKSMMEKKIAHFVGKIRAVLPPTHGK